MAESNLPIAPAPEAPSRIPAEAPDGGGEGGGDGADRRTERGAPAGPVPRAVAGALAFLLGLVAVLGVAALAGEPLRNGVLVETDVDPAGSELSFTDAPEEAAGFFADRDSLTVRVPWDMSVSEFLALYHLENNASVREALRAQLGAAEPADPLREGDAVTFALTLRRPAP